MSGVRIVVVGGGSSYTPELVSGLLETPGLEVERLTLVDVEAGRQKLEEVRGFCQRLIDASGSKMRLDATFDRREPLRQADFVLSQFRVGGLAARERDERIPLKFGAIGQETVGAGGFAKALRTIPVTLALARELEAVNPQAWFINFTNPSGMVTEALLKHSSIRAIGLCNVPITIERLIAQAMGVPPEAVSLDIFGLNHLSFVRAVYVGGKDITPAVLEFLRSPSTQVANIPDQQWTREVLGAIRMLPNPYLQYYWNPDVMLKAEQEEVSSGLGTRATQVMAIEKALFAQYRDPAVVTVPAELMKRGGAYYSTVAVMLIESLALNRRREIVVNVKNGTSMPELPENCVVEVPAMVDARGAVALQSGLMPPTVRGLVQQVKAYEELTIGAAVSGSREVALAALMANPLVPSSSTATALLDEIIRENAAYLPGFAL